MEEEFPALPSEADNKVKKLYKHLEDTYWPKLTDEEKSQFRKHLEYIKFTPSTASYGKHVIAKRCEKGSDEIFYILANAIWGKGIVKNKKWYEVHRELLDRFPSKPCELALSAMRRESKHPSEIVEPAKKNTNVVENMDKEAPVKSTKAKKNKPKPQKASQAEPSTSSSAMGQSLSICEIEGYITEIKRQHGLQRQDHEFMIAGLQEMFENTIHRANSELAHSEGKFSNAIGVLEEAVLRVREDMMESFSRIQRSFGPSTPATRNGSEVEEEERSNSKRKGEELTKELIKLGPRHFDIDLTEETGDDASAFLDE